MTFYYPVVEFIVFFPRYSRAGQVDSKPLSTPVQSGKERILFVDDEVQIAELARSKWEAGDINTSEPVLPHYVRRSEAEVKWEKGRQKKASGG